MKRSYLKGWLEKTIATIDVIATLMVGMMADTPTTPISTMMIPATIVVICSIILLKYGRLGN